MITEATEIIRKEETIAEERIWQAVIVSTIEEWISGPLRRSREAEYFLFRDQNDFPFVCQSAGIDPDSLRQRLIRLRDKLAIRLDSRPTHN